MAAYNVRPLHWVFKIGDRALTAKFYREILGMMVLRHEEFKQGCAAACNGPYDNRWSKTMMGYGPEATHFVVELTYNYNVFSYERGNDFHGITIKSKEAIARAREAEWPMTEQGGKFKVEAPGGYPFYLIDEPQPTESDPVQEVNIACADVNRSLNYWHILLKADVYKNEPGSATIGFSREKCRIVLTEVGYVDRKEAYGRIAFAIPGEQLKPLQDRMETAKTTVLTPYIKLDTPGKASVVVVILADPDGHEICFVDEEGFSELSHFELEGEAMLDRYINKDLRDRADLHSDLHSTSGSEPAAQS